MVYSLQKKGTIYCRNFRWLFLQAILFNFWLTGTKEEIQQLKVKLQNHFSINNKAIPSNKTTNNTNTNKIESQNEVYDASKYRKHAWKGGEIHFQTSHLSMIG